MAGGGPSGGWRGKGSYMVKYIVKYIYIVRCRGWANVGAWNAWMVTKESICLFVGGKVNERLVMGCLRR